MSLQGRKIVKIKVYVNEVYKRDVKFGYPSSRHHCTIDELELCVRNCFREYNYNLVEFRTPSDIFVSGDAFMTDFNCFCTGTLKEPEGFY